MTDAGFDMKEIVIDECPMFNSVWTIIDIYINDIF